MRTRITVALAAALTAALLAAPGLASASAKDYSLTIAPASVPGGATVAMTARFVNESATQQLGSADLTPPPGFTVTQASVPSGSAAVVGGLVELRNLSLPPGGSVTATLTVATPSACTTTGSWASEAKQANNFNGTGNDLVLDTAASQVTTTANGVCAVRFGTQPHNAVVGQAITGTDFTPTAPPVTVQLVDSAGHLVASAGGPVTIALGSNPGAGRLSGTTTVTAVDGVASFANLTIDKAANGYTLVATGPGSSGSATSSGFQEQNASTACPQDQSCQTTVGTAASHLQVTASPVSGTQNAGYLSESVNAQNAQALTCAGYTNRDASTYEFYVSNVNRSKTLTHTIVEPAVPLTGTTDAILSSTQYCYGAPYDFVTSAGTPAPAGTLPDGTPGFVGLLPNCGTAGATVCISSRSSQVDLSSTLGFDIVLTVTVPPGLPGDPWGRP